MNRGPFISRGESPGGIEARMTECDGGVGWLSFRLHCLKRESIPADPKVLVS